MSWITPKTDWTELDRVTYADMNRIAGNLNELGSTSLKADYTQDDVVSKAQWGAIVDAVKDLVENEGYTTEDEPNKTDATALNFNIVEGLTREVKDWIDLKTRQHAADIYAGDDLYAGTMAGDYARGGD